MAENVLVLECFSQTVPSVLSITPEAVLATQFRDMKNMLEIQGDRREKGRQVKVKR